MPVAVDLAPACQIDPRIRPLLPAGRQPDLFGRAITVRCAPPDFGAVLHGAGAIRRGAGDRCRLSGWYRDDRRRPWGGELHRKGASGVVCGGAVRDTAGLAGMTGFAVFARSINPRGPDSAAKGEVNGRVTIGGFAVAPGDLVIGDADGLVALPPEMLHALIDAAEAKLAQEAGWRTRLAAGEPIGTIFGLA